MNTCTDVRALLPLVVGGDLEEDQAVAVSEHLERGCEACSAALRELERTRGHLLELPQRHPAPAVDLWPGVRAALQAEGLLRTGGIVVRRARFGVRGTWLSAAAATLLVAGGAWSLLRERALNERLPSLPAVADSGAVAPGGVAPDLAPTLVGGPSAGGGLRPLAPGETPFALEAEVFGLDPSRIRIGPHGGALDPSRPTLVGDRGQR